jgi:hypothetical protein
MKALVQDGGAGPGAEALAWAEAVRNAVESHWRDFQATQRWTRWLPGRPPAPGDLPAGSSTCGEALPRGPRPDSPRPLRESPREDRGPRGWRAGSGPGGPVAADPCEVPRGPPRRPALASVAHLASVVEQMDFSSSIPSAGSSRSATARPRGGSTRLPRSPCRRRAWRAHRDRAATPVGTGSASAVADAPWQGIGAGLWSA